jgi:hypothetical protein
VGYGDRTLRRHCVDFTIMHNCGGVTDVTAQLSVPSKNREAPRK